MQKDSKNKKVTVSQLEHDLQQVCEHHQRAMKLLYEKSATISEITKTVVEGLENIRQSLVSLEAKLNKIAKSEDKDGRNNTQKE